MNLKISIGNSKLKHYYSLVADIKGNKTAPFVVHKKWEIFAGNIDYQGKNPIAKYNGDIFLKDQSKISLIYSVIDLLEFLKSQEWENGTLYLRTVGYKNKVINDPDVVRLTSEMNITLRKLKSKSKKKG